ncbi:hypothetical protein TFLX_04361 [Thermoflexales bacterium]|nr:hypothetical protein TFLX_04361 [Thermoflexales bacterium]
MKRALSFIISFLLIALILFISPPPGALPSYINDFPPLLTNKPVVTTRLAFCIQSRVGDQSGVLSLADLRTGHVSSVAPCDKLAWRLSWSPTGKYLALDANSGLWGPHGWVADIARRSVEKVFMDKRFGGFYQWTEDGRYAIFDQGDQYDNSETVVFDALDWKIVFNSRSASCVGSMEGACKQGSAVVYPQDSLLLYDGTVVHLPNLARNQLIPHQYIANVTWSPNKAHLALIGYSKHLKGFDAALYLTNANGTEAEAVAPVAEPWGFLQWSLDGDSVTYWDDEAKLVVDVAHLSVQTTPTSKEEALPPSRQESLCGDVEKTRENLSQSVKGISALCWSTDRRLLAVSTHNAVRIYDEHLTLLREIPCTGDVTAMAWSPVP